MSDAGTDNYFEVTTLADGSLQVLARAVADDGTIGHIDRIIAPDDPDYNRFAQYATPPSDR